MKNSTTKKHSDSGHGGWSILQRCLLYLAFLFAGIIWVVVFLVSRYVSLASIVAAICLPLAATALAIWRGGVSPLVVCFFYGIGVAAVWKHRANIRRLRDGTELRFERRKK